MKIYEILDENEFLPEPEPPELVSSYTQPMIQPVQPQYMPPPVPTKYLARHALTPIIDHKVYAIGDIHGMLRTLKAAHSWITKDSNKDFKSNKSVVVHLGDYIDRGPDSAGVIRLLKQGSQNQEWICLRGNHEDMLLDAYKEAITRGQGNKCDAWLNIGGVATLKSYKLKKTQIHLIPKGDIDWISTLPHMYQDNHRVFVHAGMRPHTHIDQQEPKDLMGIRGQFLKRKHDFGKLVVHGHTVGSEPVVKKHRLGLDTGAVYGGQLSVAVFDPTSKKPRIKQFFNSKDLVEYILPEWTDFI